MKITIDSFLSILIVAIAVLICGQLINEHSQINEARNYHSEVIDRLETSYFNPSVIADIEDEIKQLNSEGKGYTISITDVTEDVSEENTIYTENRIMRVILNYNVSIPLFGVIDEGVISGYAR